MEHDRSHTILSVRQHLELGARVYNREIISNIVRCSAQAVNRLKSGPTPKPTEAVSSAQLPLVSLRLNLATLRDILKRLEPSSSTQEVTSALELLHHVDRLANYFLPHTALWYWWASGNPTSDDLEAAIKLLLKQIKDLDLV